MIQIVVGDATVVSFQPLILFSNFFEYLTYEVLSSVITHVPLLSLLTALQLHALVLLSWSVFLYLKRNHYAFIYNYCQFHMIWGNGIIILLISSIKIYNWELKFEAGREKWRKVFQDASLERNFWEGNACVHAFMYACVCVYLCTWWWASILHSYLCYL